MAIGDILAEAIANIIADGALEWLWRKVLVPVLRFPGVFVGWILGTASFTEAWSAQDGFFRVLVSILFHLGWVVVLVRIA